MTYEESPMLKMYKRLEKDASEMIAARDAKIAELAAELEAERQKTRALSEALSDANRWIPVGERLPESHEARCFYCDPYEIGLCSFSRGLFWPDDANGCFDTMVTHWRPLPEPPEGTR